MDLLIAEGITQLLQPGGIPGPQLRSAMQPGNRVVLKAITDLSSSPSEILAGITQIIGANIELHALDVGPIDVALPVLRVGLGIGAEIEAKRLAEQVAARQVEDRWVKTFAAYQSQVGQSIVDRLGPAALLPELELPSSVVELMPFEANGHAPEPDLTMIGRFLKTRREAMGITQAALAAELGIDASRVSRAEKAGEGPHILKMFSRLAPSLPTRPGGAERCRHPTLLARRRRRCTARTDKH